MVDIGSGSPIVVIPGVQGRWEWMEPAIRSLAVRHRVLSFSLGDTGSGLACGKLRGHPSDEVPGVFTGSGLACGKLRGHPSDDVPGVFHRRDPTPFDTWIDHVDALLDHARVSAAAIVGVSFGGLVGVRYAAERPARVSSLVLVSVPPPRFQLDRTSLVFLKYPRLALPAFALRGVRRLFPETIAAREQWRSRLQFLREYAGRAMRFPASPTSMAACVHAWERTDLTADCGRISAPTLVITGERHLDRVVPVRQTMEYLDLIHDARHIEFRRTGHVGFVSRPDDFARIVSSFLGTDVEDARAPRARTPHLAGESRMTCR
jgi:pimeloyl-ACP methyl ester carboxylesterase